MITLVQQYFSESANKYPDKPAICCQSNNITYREADQFTNALAKELYQQGVRRGSFVPFFMKKSIHSVLSIIGILKADCAYIPIDTNTPENRLASIIQATEAKLIIVNDESQVLLEALLPKENTFILFNISTFKPTDTQPIQYQNLSIDLAYVLFTSGSTGVPKGVMIPHKAIIDYIDWCVETYKLDENDRISNHAPLYFDNSTFDLYTAFKTGATLHLVPESLNAVLPRLIKWLGENQISTFFCVPSVLTLLLKSRRLKQDSFPHLRHMICAGEVLPPDVLRAWMEKYPDIQFTNMYGPTEITVDCSYYVIQQAPKPGTQAIPIGKARANMELFIRTEDGTICQEKGIKGELLVRGTSVANGYLGDREKTQKSFIQNPNNALFHDPLYCTGDLVTIDQRGDFVFLGRIDDQIKHLGYRIELGEVEASLVTIECIEEGVVVYGMLNDDDSDTEIGALISLKKNTDSTSNDIKEKLKSVLPPYMVPTRIKIHQDTFPRTPNGKYDRKAIKDIVFTKAASPH